MTLIRKRTLKLVAVVLIAALVLLMLPMTAKAATWTPDEPTDPSDPSTGAWDVQICTDGVKTDDSGTAETMLARVYDGTITGDSITVDASAKTVTFVNVTFEADKEVYLEQLVDGWTFVFEGTNKIPGFEAMARLNLNIDIKDGSSLTLTGVRTEGFFLAFNLTGSTITLADGVSATPTDYMSATSGTIVFSKGGSSEDTPTNDYVINDGSTDSITAQTGKDLVIKCSGPLEHLSKVLMDGNEVSEENMSLESGSTILTLKAAYLATLAAGEHTVSFVYDDGTTVDATFTLAKTPQTGDPMATYVLVVAIAAGVATTVVFAKKKSANE